MIERPHDHLRCPLFHELDGECCQHGETCCMLAPPQIILQDHDVAAPLINMGVNLQYSVLAVFLVLLIIFGAPKMDRYFAEQAKINQELVANAR